MFHCACCTFLLRAIGYILAHISMTTRARDFKFAAAIVQRLYLVMVALTKNLLSAQYGCFCHGRSHIIVIQVCLMSQLWDNVSNMHELLTACSV